jgi:hypothetical protein
MHHFMTTPYLHTCLLAPICNGPLAAFKLVLSVCSKLYSWKDCLYLYVENVGPVWTMVKKKSIG